MSRHIGDITSVPMAVRESLHSMAQCYSFIYCGGEKPIQNCPAAADKNPPFTQTLIGDYANIVEMLRSGKLLVPIP